MPRLLFEKTGSAIWISHLDLMRVFQRSFKRAGLPLTHTQGFNPRPSVSIALPLSVGVESACELLDFELDGDSIPCEEICSRLNRVLIPGVHVLDVYTDGRKLRDLSVLHCAVTLEYDGGIPANSAVVLKDVFASEQLIVPKKSKNGIQDQDIIPMIRRCDVLTTGDNTVVLDCDICCQSPTLNPMQLAVAINLYRTELKPDYVKCKRIEIYDNNMNVFR